MIHGVQRAHPAAVGSLFAAAEEGRVDALPAQPLPFRQHRLAHRPGVLALAAHGQEGRFGAVVVADEKALVDEPLVIELGVQGAGLADEQIACQVAQQLQTQVLLALRVGRALEAQHEVAGRDRHLLHTLRLRRGLRFRLAPVLFRHLLPFLRQQQTGGLRHPLRVHVADDAQGHVAGLVEGIVALVEGFGGDVGDGLPAPGQGDAQGVVLVQRPLEVLVHPPGGVVFYHLNLLPDDALLLVHALLGEIALRDKGEQGAQVLLEPLGAVKIVSRHGRRREGVGRGAVGGEFLQGVALLGVEHLVFQKMRHPRRGLLPHAVLAEADVHAAVAGGEEGVGFQVAWAGDDLYLQAVVQDGLIADLAQSGELYSFHWASSSPPSGPIRK